MDFVIFSALLVVLIILSSLFERKLNALIKLNKINGHKLNVLLLNAELTYPLPEQLTDKILENMLDISKPDACNMLIDEFGCTFEQAEKLYALWSKRNGR